MCCSSVGKSPFPALDLRKRNSRDCPAKASFGKAPAPVLNQCKPSCLLHCTGLGCQAALDVLASTPHHSETLSHVFWGQDSMWCVSTWLVCLKSSCLVLLSAEGPTGGLVLSRDQAENGVNKQGLKTGPLTARRKMGYVVGQYKCSTPSLSSVTMFFVLGMFFKGKRD